MDPENGASTLTVGSTANMPSNLSFSNWSSRDTAFIDLATISGPIFDIVYAAGWDVDDVAAAVEELAVNYQRGLWANRRTDAAIVVALSCAAKQKALE